MSVVRKVLQLMANDEKLIAEAIENPRIIPDDTRKIIVVTSTLLGYGSNEIRLKNKIKIILSDESIASLDDELEHHMITDESVIATIIHALERIQKFRELKLDLDRDHYNRTKKRLEDNAREIKQYGGKAEVYLPSFPLDIINGLAVGLLGRGSISKDAFLSIIKLSGIYSKDAGKKAREQRSKEFEKWINDATTKEDDSLEYELRPYDTLQETLENLKKTLLDCPIIILQINESDEVIGIELHDED